MVFEEEGKWHVAIEGPNHNDYRDYKRTFAKVTTAKRFAQNKLAEKIRSEIMKLQRLANHVEYEVQP